MVMNFAARRSTSRFRHDRPDQKDSTRLGNNNVHLSDEICTVICALLDRAEGYSRQKAQDDLPLPQLQSLKKQIARFRISSFAGHPAFRRRIHQ